MNLPCRLRALVASAGPAVMIFGCVQAATFQGLGDLPGGGVQGYAIGVSADGTTVVGHSLSAAGDEAFRWTADSGIVGLGDFPLGAFDSFATMASNAGTVVVGYGTLASLYRPFRWTSAEGMVDLGDLPGGGANGFATGMSADASVICGQSSSASGTEAFRWTATGGMVGLGDLPGGAFDSSAWGVSADGTAVIGDGTTAAGREAFIWTSAGGLVPLGFLPGGGSYSGAHGVSNGGTFVVGASDSTNTTPGNGEAYRWSAAGGMVGLGDLPGGTFNSFANGVSADGRVVVGGSDTSSGTQAMFWTSQCGMRNLKEYLLALGVTGVSGWTLQDAHGVSSDGGVIVGYGINPSGNTEPWIARFPPCGAGSGSVPDGAGGLGVPLKVDKGIGGEITLSWSTSCLASDVDYAVYEGALGNFASHTQRACSTSGTTAATLVPGAGDTYYLVVPHNLSVEGSYGTDSSGAERPASPAACFAQTIENCPGDPPSLRSAK